MDEEKNKVDIAEMKIKRNFIGKITNVCVNYFELIILLILMITSLGLYSIVSMPKESLPEIVFPALIIQTPYIGATPEDVEITVTNEIEDKVCELDDIDTLSSTSSFGFSSVVIQFNEGVDINLKRLETSSLLSELDFPDGVSSSQIIAFKTSEFPLMNLSVTGDYDIYKLTNYAEEIKDKVEDIPGVDEAIIKGKLKRQVNVIINEPLMYQYGISMNDIKNALSSMNASFPLGEVKLGSENYSLRVDETIVSIEDIRNTIITNGKGTKLFLSDLATVVDTSEEVREISRSYSNITDLNKSVVIQVQREKNSDVIGTSDNIKKAIAKMKGTSYPKDVDVVASSDQADYVSEDLNKIKSSAFSGLAVVIIVLLLFIGVKESLIVSLTIPLSLLTSLSILSVFGVTLNTFVILGLIVSLGLLVDNSIIVMENINRLQKKGLSAKDASISGTNQVGIPILSATLTTIAAFFPLAILPGVAGDFINNIPRTIIVTLAASIAVAISIIPSVCAKVLKVKFKPDGYDTEKTKKHHFLKSILKVIFVAMLSFYAFYSGKDSILLTGIMMTFFLFLIIAKEFFTKSKSFENSVVAKWYEKTIRSIICSRKKKVLVVITALLILGSSFSLLGTGALKVSFFPEAEPSSLIVNIDLPGGSSLEKASDIVAKVEEILIESENIKLFNTVIGGSEIDFATISAEFVDKENMTMNGFEFVEVINDKFAKIPGAKITIQSVVAGPPTSRPIEVEIVGDDLEGAKKLAREYENKLKQIPGVYNSEISLSSGGPELYIDINKAKAQNLGFSTSTIGLQLRNLIDGITATTAKIDNESVDIILKLDDEKISDIRKIENLILQTQSGENIPLSHIAKVVKLEGVSSINHEDKVRILTIGSDLKQGYNASEVTAEFRKSVENIEIPKSLDVIYAGDVEDIQENFGNLFQSMIVAVFLVFIILTVQFNSLAQPFVILMTVPMSLIGVLYGLLITGNSFGFYAFIGIVALVGIAVNDAIVLIDYMNYLRCEGKGLNEAIVEAGITRFNPVIATTLTTIGGVLPLAFKDAYYEQFSYTLIFGLLVTTILTLVIIPIGYSAIEGVKMKFSKNKTTCKNYSKAGESFE